MATETENGVMTVSTYCRSWLPLVALAFAIVLGTLPALAQDADMQAPGYLSYVEIGSRGELILTPDTAARLVVERNLQLAAAAEGIDAAGGRLAQARAASGLSAKVSGVFLRKGPVTNFDVPGGPGGPDGGGDGQPVAGS